MKLSTYELRKIEERCPANGVHAVELEHKMVASTPALVCTYLDKKSKPVAQVAIAREYRP